MKNPKPLRTVRSRKSVNQKERGSGGREAVRLQVLPHQNLIKARQIPLLTRRGARSTTTGVEDVMIAVIERGPGVIIIMIGGEMKGGKEAGVDECKS